MKIKNKFVPIILVLPLLHACNVDYAAIEKKAQKFNHYEAVSLKLAKENRELKAEIKRLEFEIEKVKNGGPSTVAHHAPEHSTHSEHNGHSDGHQKREIASVTPMLESNLKTDFVQFKTYKWHAEDMHSIADKEFKSKNFEKASQFYYSIVENYPHYNKIDDEFYFKAGISAYESGSHHEWTLKHFSVLMKDYPTSKYYRSAKLWVALTHLKQGEKKKFFETVEEFRKKYRNTSEWKILSSYYEKIEEKTNE